MARKWRPCDMNLAFTRGALFLAVCVGLSTAHARSAWGQDQAVRPDPSAVATDLPLPPEIGAIEPSEAERVATLQRTIQADQTHLSSLESQLRNHDLELEWASDRFRQLEDDLEEHLGQVAHWRDAEQTSEALAAAEETPRLQTQVDLARERLEAALQLRKATQKQIAALRQKIEANNRALQRLLGEELSRASAATGPHGEEPPRNDPTVAHARQVDRMNGPAADVSQSPLVATTSEPVTENSHASIEANFDAAAGDQKVTEARAAVAATRNAAEVAQQRVDEVQSRLETLETSIVLEQEARDAARRQADNAMQTLAVLNGELQQRIQGDADRDELENLRSRIEEARLRLARSRDESKKRAIELERLLAERSDLSTQRQFASWRLEQESRKAEAARKQLQWLENPLSSHNVMRWSIRSGGVVLAILLGMWLVRWLLRLAVGRLVRFMSAAGGRDNEEEQAQRAALFGAILKKGGGLAIFVGGGLLILSELGVQIALLWTFVSAIFAMIAIGFIAVWSVASNSLCALILLIYQPFKIGSMIELTALGVKGKVVNFNLIYTTVRCDLGDRIEVPNNMFFQQPIRHREKGAVIGLDEQLTKQADTHVSSPRSDSNAVA